MPTKLKNLLMHQTIGERILGEEVVMMASPTMNHIFIAGNIYRIFGDYLDGKKCAPIPDGATLFLADGEEYKPAMMVVCDPDKLSKKGVCGAPDLVVEVLSSSAARADKGYKKKAYERCGVREYWIVDPLGLSVEQYALEDGEFVLRDVYTHYLPADLEDMTDEEKAAVVKEFKCGLFDDLTIRLKDIFYRVANVQAEHQT